MKKVIVIGGPTSSGKTSLSVKLAQIFNGEIINTDSVQMYKEFNIGSAKITEKEKKNIKHHLLDIINPEQKYNIYEFQKSVRKIIPKIDIPFLVGGSGLYIKSALFDYEFEKEKKKYNKKKINNKQMIEIIKQKDPNLILDQKNPHRVKRAFEQTYHKKLRSQKNGKNNPLFDILTIYLDLPKQILKERIEQRLEKMLKSGFILEVERLIKKFPKANFNIIGYREIKMFLENKINLNETKKIIISKTMKYAKRQKTWFKNQFDSLIIINALSEKITEKSSEIIFNFLKTKKEKN
ncbi:tRNA (adenosine(37)-N6)-dimethylallyltransferase MiaA ['Cynodon dactylon' phytoplasma]|uniref:tRNA (adenosine(37)-N6)-dimethylallyltransferase MiaA n=1 Tax='Cynodon dactylon' phytoplasma TaxID=295320 RepID=UPI001265BB69|nr:tRNA (adenosine(37)-N6)-dimethylallyltransferase MiaA ['Cynodon dactylon' phytoplasma]KAB8122127.1 tRNA (adenosine(37)-N6)-dimethylallyltransferase MiaA ['Cynodon dactylon' phytoplasma]